MKQKGALLIITLSLSACGQGYRRGVSAQNNEEIEQKTTQNLQNLEPGIYEKNYLAETKEQFQLLGAFESKALPEEIRILNDRSVIGTLSLKIRNETYLPSYDQQVTPVVNCDQTATCAVTIHVHAFMFDARQSIQMKWGNIAGRKECTENQPYYRKSETKEMTSVPLEAQIRLNGVSADSDPDFQFKL